MSSTLKALGLIGPSLLRQQQDDGDDDAADLLLSFLPQDPQQQQDELCPCPYHYQRDDYGGSRFLQTDEEEVKEDAPTWQVVYTCLVLVIMFGALITDKFGADSIMLTALTAFLAAEVITLKEGLEGFANQGLLTVLVLFVVAQGISKTGALDWYMGKLLGQQPGPSAASAQLRLMVPVATVSAFLNNTPLVVVMIPIVLRWARQIRVSVQQLLVPLSFASLLGGVCTLIGTSTNLVVVGLLEDRYPNDPELNIGLFDLGEFGVPVAMAGMAYILLLSPFLLPGGKRGGGSSNKDGVPVDNMAMDDLLLGARLTPWSPAAGRTIQRSGLRDTGGIYLVSVHRAATGNVHRAVSNDFVLNTGDILYFTGLVESFGTFCEEHGLEVVTNEVENAADAATTGEVEEVENGAAFSSNGGGATSNMADAVDRGPNLQSVKDDGLLATVEEDLYLDSAGVPVEVGITKESLLHADEWERTRSINRITDLIRGVQPSPAEEATPQKKKPPAAGRGKRASERLAGAATKIVVTIDKDLLVVGINTHDRAGLLLDIAKGLLRFNLQLRHTEAAVVSERSLSIWRCKLAGGTGLPDIEEVWSVLHALLSNEGVEALKQRGLRVIRARVLKGSRLIGKKATEVNFRQVYKAAIVAVQKSNNNKTPTGALSSVRFDVGDVLVLQASEDSPLLNQPPNDFYKKLYESMKDAGKVSRSSSVGGFVRMLTQRRSGDLASQGSGEDLGGDSLPAENNDFFNPSDNLGNDAAANDEEAQVVGMVVVLEDAERMVQDEVWKDLYVVFQQEDESGEKATREFLTAMQVAPKSQHVGKTVAQVGIQKLPDLFLVSIDRPVAKEEEDASISAVLAGLGDASIVAENSSVLSTMRAEIHPFEGVDPDEPLREGDVLWFSGPASAVGDLRKIPGLVSYQNEEVKKITGRIHERRLVQAVVARRGPLVGKTVKTIRFRTRYGAAVIAVHREGKRVHEHPGNVKLQAGDVLLLEAGRSFMAKNSEGNNTSFVLLAEVEDSAPPRLRLLVPALLITVGMLAVFMAGLTSLLVSGLVASILMVVLGILSEQEARDAVNWDIYITIASAFGIGTALLNSGVADAIAKFLVNIGEGLGIGDAGLVGAVYFATFLISNVVTNNAAAALLFPIAMNAAEQTGVSRVIMSYSLMLGASASFMSPYGYTTNLLIFGPGGYRTMDFIKFGTPMQIVLWVLSTLYLTVIKPWYISWLATGLCLVLIAFSRVGASSLGSRWPGKKRPQELATTDDAT